MASVTLPTDFRGNTQKNVIQERSNVLIYFHIDLVRYDVLLCQPQCFPHIDLTQAVRLQVYKWQTYYTSSSWRTTPSVINCVTSGLTIYLLFKMGRIAFHCKAAQNTTFTLRSLSGRQILSWSIINLMLCYLQLFYQNEMINVTSVTLLSNAGSVFYHVPALLHDIVKARLGIV